LNLAHGRKNSIESLPPPYSLAENPDENQVVQIRASCYRRSCRPWCSCRCHVRRSIRSPSLATDFLGSLFIGFSGVPGLTEVCNESQCNRRSQVRLIASYQFPKWMWTRALFASFMTSKLHGPEMILRVKNTIPYTSETYQCCLNGELGLLKRRFDDGLASPFDVDPEGVSLVHVSPTRSRIPPKSTSKRDAACSELEPIQNTVAFDIIRCRSLSGRSVSTNKLCF
jgi:hypothetical protein